MTDGVPASLSTNQKGAIAESAIVHAAVKLGLEVYKPVAEGGRYDMIIAIADRLERVQCKWAALKGDVVQIRAYSCRRTRTGLLKRAYTKDEVDAIAAYCAALDRCLYFPVDWLAGRTVVQLRLAQRRTTSGSGSTGSMTLRSSGYDLTPRGRSSAGRAPEWHSGGQGFDPPRLHRFRCQGRRSPGERSTTTSGEHDRRCARPL